MPTIVSHAAVPLALGLGLGSRVIPTRLLMAGIAASIVPDFDTFGMRWGVDFFSIWGHRGFSHSVLSSGGLAMLAALMARYLKAPALTAALFVFIAAISHGLLDMATNGGPGVALAWPWSDQRWFFGFRPIAVSPLQLSAFLTPRGLGVIRSELFWVWLPCVTAGFALLMVRITLRRDRRAGE